LDLGTLGTRVTRVGRVWRSGTLLGVVRSVGSVLLDLGQTKRSMPSCAP
jgi:hypothetical protein